MVKESSSTTCPGKGCFLMGPEERHKVSRSSRPGGRQSMYENQAKTKQKHFGKNTPVLQRGRDFKLRLGLSVFQSCEPSIWEQDPAASGQGAGSKEKAWQQEDQAKAPLWVRTQAEQRRSEGTERESWTEEPQKEVGDEQNRKNLGKGHYCCLLLCLRTVQVWGFPRTQAEPSGQRVGHCSVWQQHLEGHSG